MGWKNILKGEGPMDEGSLNSNPRTKIPRIPKIERNSQDYYNERIQLVIAGFNSKGISIMDIPESMRHKALALERQITEAANAGNRDKIHSLLWQWRDCFH